MAKEKHVIKVTERKELGTSAARRARHDGLVPAVVYGHGAEPAQYLIDAKDWAAIAKQDVQIVQLQPGKGKEVNVLIKDVQFDYLKNITMHVDFQEVNMNETIHATVPLHLIGTPAGLSQGGLLEQQMYEIDIICTPLNMPEYIEVDVSELQLHDIVHAGDIKVPESVKFDGDPKVVVLHIVEARVSDDEEGEEEEEIGGEAAAE